MRTRPVSPTTPTTRSTQFRSGAVRYLSPTALVHTFPYLTMKP